MENLLRSNQLTQQRSARYVEFVLVVALVTAVLGARLHHPVIPFFMLWCAGWCVLGWSILPRTDSRTSFK